MDKKGKFSQKQLVDFYDNKRFGSKSGRHVDEREKTVFLRYLKDVKGPILDLACGTGRYSELLSSMGKKVVGVDYSSEMLKKASMKFEKVEFVRSDAFMLPFKDGVFEGVVAGRFFQHYKNIVPLLKEIVRVTRKDKYIVFDMLKWSPKQIFALLHDKHARAVYTHNEKELMEISEELNFSIEEKDTIFLFSPAVYRYLPLFLIYVLDFIEKIIPKRYRVRDFWKLKKP